jgi:hypothetical protein
MSPFRAARTPALAGLAFMAGLLLSGPVPAQQPPPPNRDVTLQNETDMVLRELYVAPPNASDRGADRLGSETVAPGGNLRIRLGRTRDCAFDVTAVFADGSEELRRRVDLCRNPRLVFGDPSLPWREVAVANRSSVLLRELYASSRGPDAWGPDRLGAEVIEAGAEFRLRLRSRDCVFDLRAVYADEREEVKERQDLCANRAVAFDRSGIPRGPRRVAILANRHLATVQEIYVSPSSESDWGPDRLGSQTLPVGGDATAEWDGACEVDVRIVFPNGGAEERRELDACENPRIVLRPGWVLAEQVGEEGAVPAQDPERTSPGALRLRNAGPLPIIEVYAAPPGAPRGEDRLGADTLPVGETLEVTPPDANACLADLVVLFRDGREVTRPGVDLCAGEEIEIR